MNLSEYNETQGTYVGVKLDEASQQELITLQRVLRLTNPLDSKQFHATILYSRKQLDVPATDNTYQAKVNYVDCWKTQDGKYAVVAKLSCDALSERHDDLISAGGTHDYPDYSPHVTLSYDDKITPLFVNLDIRLVDEYVEPLDLNWIENNE
ncbi:RNA ligase/cyclic nucleotide phosphodiesterase [Vibrio phage 1.081.O._10N.286.52.C2]|nr:RNA ligase/cyclic nucleotide phosphodiesterase [Vibrio phage 1.081.O._10N.286.52.C2]